MVEERSSLWGVRDINASCTDSEEDSVLDLSLHYASVEADDGDRDDYKVTHILVPV